MQKLQYIVLAIVIAFTAASAEADSMKTQAYGMVKMLEDGTLKIHHTFVMDGNYSDGETILHPGDTHYATELKKYQPITVGENKLFDVAPGGQIHYRQAKAGNQ